MTELSCPLCKSDSYLNPDIKIYISPCYHKMCKSCLNRIFTSIQAPCPECITALRKINYISQTFEDMSVERECKIRKLLNRIYFRLPEDFINVILYNDYLEDFENIVFELMDLKDEEMMNLTLEKMKHKWGEISRTNHEKIATATKMKRTGAEQEVVEKIKRIKVIKQEIEEEEEEFNPLADLEIPTIFVTAKHKIPDHYKINFAAGGFTENLLIYKGIYSVYDDLI